MTKHFLKFHIKTQLFDPLYYRSLFDFIEGSIPSKKSNNEFSFDLSKDRL